MLEYIIRRLLWAIPTLFVISILSFFLMKLPPGDYLSSYAATLSQMGEGMPAEQIPGKVGQASEGLDSVPLLAEAAARAGLQAEGLQGLAALIEGSIDPGEWVAGLRRAERARRAA